MRKLKDKLQNIEINKNNNYGEFQLNVPLLMESVNLLVMELQVQLDVLLLLQALLELVKLLVWVQKIHLLMDVQLFLVFPLKLLVLLLLTKELHLEYLNACHI